MRISKISHSNDNSLNPEPDAVQEIDVSHDIAHVSHPGKNSESPPIKLKNVSNLEEALAIIEKCTQKKTGKKAYVARNRQGWSIIKLDKTQRQSRKVEHPDTTIAHFKNDIQQLISEENPNPEIIEELKILCHTFEELKITKSIHLLKNHENANSQEFHDSMKFLLYKAQTNPEILKRQIPQKENVLFVAVQIPEYSHLLKPLIENISSSMLLEKNSKKKTLLKTLVQHQTDLELLKQLVAKAVTSEASSIQLLHAVFEEILSTQSTENILELLPLFGNEHLIGQLSLQLSILSKADKLDSNVLEALINKNPALLTNIDREKHTGLHWLAKIPAINGLILEWMETYKISSDKLAQTNQFNSNILDIALRHQTNLEFLKEILSKGIPAVSDQHLPLTLRILLLHQSEDNILELLPLFRDACLVDQTKHHPSILTSSQNMTDKVLDALVSKNPAILTHIDSSNHMGLHRVVENPNSYKLILTWMDKYNIPFTTLTQRTAPSPRNTQKNILEIAIQHQTNVGFLQVLIAKASRASKADLLKALLLAVEYQKSNLLNLLPLFSKKFLNSLSPTEVLKIGKDKVVFEKIIEIAPKVIHNKDTNDHTLLHMMTTGQSDDMLSILLEKASASDLAEIDTKGITPLEIAMQHIQKPELLKQILNKVDADTFPNWFSVLNEAFKKQKSAAIIDLLSYLPTTVLETRNKGNFPLRMAIKASVAPEIVVALVKKAPSTLEATEDSSPHIFARLLSSNKKNADKNELKKKYLTALLELPELHLSENSKRRLLIYTLNNPYIWDIIEKQKFEIANYDVVEGPMLPHTGLEESIVADHLEYWLKEASNTDAKVSEPALNFLTAFNNSFQILPTGDSLLTILLKKEKADLDLIEKLLQRGADPYIANFATAAKEPEIAITPQEEISPQEKKRKIPTSSAYELIMEDDTLRERLLRTIPHVRKALEAFEYEMEDNTLEEDFFKLFHM